MNDIIRGNRLEAAMQAWGRSVDFVLFSRHGDKIAHSTNIEMRVPDDSELGMSIEPTFSLRYEEVQELIDRLWQLGFRPSEGTGSAGALAATQKHLEDMRRLVFEGHKNAENNRDKSS